MQKEAQVFAELNSEIYERKVLSMSLLMIGGTDAARTACDEKTWSHATHGPAKFFREFVPHGLFTSTNSDPLWHTARAVLDPAFTREAMAGYFATIDDVVTTVTDKWLNQSEIATATDDATRLTVEIIGRIGFGRSLVDLTTDEPLAGDPTYAALETILQWGSDEANAIPIIDHLRRRNAYAHAKAASNQLFDFAEQTFNTDTAPQPGERPSMLELMRTSADADGNRLPDRTIFENVITLLIAGHETTASLISSALYYLARDPELQRSVQADIDAQAATADDLSYDTVSRMRTIHSVLQETLRLQPPAPAFFRIAKQPTTVAGHDIPAGTSAMIVLPAVHRDPTTWGPTANDFDGLRKPPAGTFFRPWGSGPRSCIGRQFALHEASVTLARLLQQATLHPDEHTDPHPTMIERGLMRPAEHRVKVQPR